MSLVLLIVLPPILLLFIALVLMWVPLPHPLPIAGSSARNLMAAIIVGILGLAYVAALTSHVVSTFLHKSRALDPVLVPRGLEGRGYLLMGRRYSGLWQGRRVEVHYLPGQGIQPPSLEMRVSARLGKRVAIGRRRPLLDCRDCPVVDLTPWGMGGLQALAQDPAWARRLLNEPLARAALGRLLGDEGPAGMRELYLQPEGAWLRSRPLGMDPDTAARWLEDVVALAGTAEGLAP